MKNAIVFRHVAHEGLGTLEQALRNIKVEVTNCDMFAGDEVPRSPDPYRLVISMGGPMGVDETDRFGFLLHEMKFIASAIERGTPVIGICLGAQLIARSLGARVYRAPRKEIGWLPIGLSQKGIRDPAFSG